MLVFWLAWHLACALALLVVGFIVIGLSGVALGVLQGRDLTAQLAVVAAVPAAGLLLKGWYDVSRWWLDHGGQRLRLVLAGVPAIVAAITFCGVVAALHS